MICGLILAGGRSSRFGCEKAMVELAGRPLIAWVAEALSPALDAVAVSARAGSGAADYAARQGWTVLADTPEDPAGPLAGVAAGLRWTAGLGGRWLCTAPCDTPFVPADLVGRLAEAANAGGAVARTADGLQPLAALWPVLALAGVEGWRDRPAPRDVLARLGAAPVDFPDATAFANLNTPQDYAAAEVAAALRLR
jgi:molybdopterin-guanine dinucleotide biosynthesis protein A